MIGGTKTGSDEHSVSTEVDLLARIRHDLRTPASHIIGFGEMLCEQAAELGFVALLPDVHCLVSAGRRLVDLIRDELVAEKVSDTRLSLSQLSQLSRLHVELRTPLNHVVGYSELLMELAEHCGAQVLIPDLQKIRAAAGIFLERMTSLLTAEALGLEAAVLPGGACIHPSGARSQVLAVSQSVMFTPVSHSPEGGLILVADDDPGNRELLARRLRQVGFEVELAEDGPRALHLLRERSFDLVLLDMIMPILDGGQVLTQIKADETLHRIPVLMLSALDEMESVVRCILMGAEDYLPKPVNSVLLRARIGACLEKSRLRQKQEAYLQALELEQKKSEALLLNILPKPIAERLKRGENTIVDSFPAVTVMFADLVGFTALASRISSFEMVRLLDDIFSAFDEIAGAEGLEKIKTIGDAYMVVGGLPQPRLDHAEVVAEVALRMLEHIAKSYQGYEFPIQIRIGIHSGPAIAGIIGRHKFSYDLWGDTVNIASRMESHGSPGRIQLTAETHELIQSKFDFEQRSEIEVKGKGRMATWFLTGRKVPRLS